MSSGLPPTIEGDRCTGCGRCVAACPSKLITLELSGFRKHAELRDVQRCTRCGLCIKACPVAAITDFTA